MIASGNTGDAPYLDVSRYPIPGGWDEFALPDIAETECYALKIVGDAWEPFYRDGNVLIVAPDSGIRHGDRVVIKTTAGEMVAGRLKCQSATRLELATLTEESSQRVLAASDIACAARIVWASQ